MIAALLRLVLVVVSAIGGSPEYRNVRETAPPPVVTDVVVDAVPDGFDVGPAMEPVVVAVCESGGWSFSYTGWLSGMPAGCSVR